MLTVTCSAGSAHTVQFVRLDRVHAEMCHLSQKVSEVSFVRCKDMTLLNRLEGVKTLHIERCPLKQIDWARLDTLHHLVLDQIASLQPHLPKIRQCPHLTFLELIVSDTKIQTRDLVPIVHHPTLETLFITDLTGQLDPDHLDSEVPEALKLMWLSTLRSKNPT